MKTVEKVCLRCDWEGETRDRVCPSCGTALWLPRSTEERGARRGPLAWFQGRRRARRPRADAEPSPQPVAAPSPAPTPDPSTHGVGPEPDRRRTWLPVTIVLVVAAIAVAIVRAGAPPPAPDAFAAAVGGRVVYALPDEVESEWYRLWIWDLAAGTVQKGPRLHEPLQMIDMSGVSPGLIGSISVAGDGLSADTIRFLGSADTATSVLRGDHVVWSPDGRRAVAASKAPGCSPIEMRTFVPAASTTSETTVGRSCADLVSLGATSPYQYVALADGGAPQISQISRYGDDPIVTGYLPVGAAGTDLFVVAATSANDADVGPALSVLWFPSGPIREPVRVGSDERQGLAFEELLSWGRFGVDTLVLGTYDGTRGIWSVPEADDGPLVPTLIAATDASNVSASVAPDGAVVAVLDGRFFVIRDGLANAPEAPEGAPSPANSVLWIPAGSAS